MTNHFLTEEADRLSVFGQPYHFFEKGNASDE